MKNLSTRALSPRRWVKAIAYVAAMGLGLKYGFDFGRRISGTGLGVLLAINGAIFCSFLVSAVVDRIVPKADSDESGS